MCTGYDETMKIKCCTLLCLLSFASSVRATPPSRLHGYVGGPYKVLIGELTGDQFPDVLLGYHQLGVVAVWQGDGQGGLTWTANNMFGDEDRALNPNDATWSVPHIHNLYLRHVDDDSLPDVVFSVGGNSRTKPGRVIVARNKGQGRFQNMAEFSTLGQAKGVALVDMDRRVALDTRTPCRSADFRFVPGWESGSMDLHSFPRQGARHITWKPPTSITMAFWTW